MKPIRLIQTIMAWLFVLFAQIGQAQTIYGVGSIPVTTNVNQNSQLFVINPTTGAATFLCQMTDASTANAVSSVNGLVYYITRATPAVLRTINPSTCVDTALPGVLPTGLDNVALRMTICPDGRMYASSSTNTWWELSLTTGAAVRTLTWSLPVGGSGDFTCTSDGTMYAVGLPTGTTTYYLFSASSASYQSVANGTSVTFSTTGPLGLTYTGAPNGIAFGPPGATGCAPAPNPCLYLSTGATSQTWVVNSLTGAATILGNTGAGITDLGSPYPMDISIVKTVTPTSALPGQTVVYTIVVGNSGTVATSAVSVIDTFPSNLLTPTWVCATNTTGLTNTVVTTSCNAASGSGNISQTANLSPGGSLRYTITGTISNNATSTMTNVARASLTVSSLTDGTASNNVSTVTTTVTPAANLQITKTDSITTTVAGATINYTVTFSNLGPSSADNAVARDTASAGLSNCSVTSCTVTGAAVCPVAGNLPNLFTGGGVAIPTFPANSSVTMIVRCGVTATGQ